MTNEKIYENLCDELVEIRHYLHENPELSEAEFETTAFLTKELEKIDVKILPSNLTSGIIAQIGSGNPVIALRADIDALPILEETKLKFASKNDGIMHACGHDLHMTSLLGAAKILKARENELNGTVKFIFQPAEEIGLGAKKMLETGLLDDVQAFVGYHNMPHLEAGKIVLREKGVMAAVERFAVKITGKGSHAAYPHEGFDSVLATAAIIQNLQQIVARNVSTFDQTVLSVTHVEAGKTWNVLPDTAFFEGTIRTFDEKTREFVKNRFVEVIENTANAYGVSAKIEWIMEAGVTYNDPNLTEILRNAAQKWHYNIGNAEPSGAGEDFAHYRAQAPSVFAFIGSNEPGSSGLHFSDMTVRDETLPAAVDYYVNSSFVLLDYFGNSEKV